MKFRKGFWIYLPVAVLAWFAPATVVRAEVQPGLNAVGYYINEIPPIQSDTTYPTCGSEIENNINRNFDGEPFQDCGWDYFMVHYTGFITIPEHTTIQFMVAADDGGTVSIAGNEFGTWDLKGCSWSAITSLDIAPGPQPLDGWFYEAGGGTCYMLAWSIDGGDWEIVPDSAFTVDSVPQSTTSTSSTTTSTTEPPTTTTEEETTTTESTTTTSTQPSTTTTSTTSTTQPPSPPSATTTTTIQEWVPPAPVATVPPTTEVEEPTTTTVDVPQEETTIPEPEQTTVPEPETTEPEVPETYPDTTTVTEVTQPVVTTEPPTAEEVTQEVEAVIEELTTIETVTDEVLAEVLDVLESGDLDKEQVQEIISAVLEADITSDQATQLATSPAVMQNVTGEQAAAIFASVDTGELTAAEAAAIIEAVQDAPTEVREAFEEEINVFGGGFDEYVPTGSVISVGARRVIVAITTVSFVLPAPVVSRRQ